LSGLLHIAANCESTDATFAFFDAVTALVPELEADKQAEFSVAVVTSLGGTFGFSGKPNVQSAPQAGAVGMLKTLAREYPGVWARAIDFDSSYSLSDIAQSLIRELRSEKDITEVGYSAGKRFVLQVEETVLDSAVPTGVTIDSDSVIVITGGARGITAEVAFDIASKYKPTLIIVGRNPRPEAHEPADTANLTGTRELKAAIMDRMKAEGQQVTIAAVEAIYQKLIREREIRSNLQRLEQTGATVRYYSMDVRDKARVAEFIGGMYETFGHIDGVISGAGIIEDAMLKDKNPDSFRRVFETKVEGANAFLKCLQLDKLKFLVFFSSVVARTGNAGQSDYVAANEVINKLAQALNRQLPGRVVSFLWGPWRGGMAQPELEEGFARFGWSMIDPLKGRQTFDDELKFGSKGDVEIMLVGQLETSSEPVSGARLAGAQRSFAADGAVQFSLTLDVAKDLYLEDHKLDNVPVLPMTMALEMMTEAACDVFPDATLFCVSDLRIFSGVLLESGPKKMRVLVEKVSQSDERILARTSLFSASSPSRPHFTATMELVYNPAIISREAESLSQHHIDGVKPGTVSEQVTPPNVTDCYRDWLFHGPLHQALTSINTFGRNGGIGTVRATKPSTALSDAGADYWVIDPLLLDSAMHLAGVWTRKYLDITCLPAGFKKLRRLAAFSDEELIARVFMPPDTTEGEFVCELVLYNRDETPVLVIEGLLGTGHKAFNRFTGLKDEAKTTA
jgi:NAD(P)-dependent dehydrogenase (short-subunit alcohol dehydrogenase family)